MRPILTLYIVLRMLVGPPLDVLVDAQNGLPAWYAPGENAEARKSLDELFEAAEAEGLKVALFSGYRSYEHQARVYVRELRLWPERADEVVARAGHSEHQLGTAFDLAWPGLPLESRDPRNMRLFAWIQAHAHEYGFVLSYPYKSTDEWPFHNRWIPYRIEFIYEPWHIRYVGSDLAVRMYSAGYLDPDSSLFPKDFYKPWP